MFCFAPNGRRRRRFRNRIHGNISKSSFRKTVEACEINTKKKEEKSNFLLNYFRLSENSYPSYSTNGAWHHIILHLVQKTLCVVHSYNIYLFSYVHSHYIVQLLHRQSPFCFARVRSCNACDIQYEESFRPIFHHSTICVHRDFSSLSSTKTTTRKVYTNARKALGHYKRCFSLKSGRKVCAIVNTYERMSR